MPEESADYIYENPPLVEVIAEIFWELKPISIAPGTFVDPHFDEFQPLIDNRLESMGFIHREAVVPEQVPLELLANQVTQRFRLEKDSWPLFQYGPGVFTANITPPYQGWSSFVPILDSGLEALWACYPKRDGKLPVRTIQLRYLDAFRHSHGYESYPQFVNEYLKLKLEVPPKLTQDASHEHTPIDYRIEVRVPLTGPTDAVAAVKVSPGTSGGEPACILECAVRMEAPHGMTNVEALGWLNEAQLVVRDWFAAICSDELTEKFGEKTYL